MAYERDAVTRWFNDYAGREWTRLESTVEGRIKYELHRRLLEAAVEPGGRVADIGCGPGRFALDIARRGATVTLVDVSRVHLTEARGRLEAGGLGGQVEAAIEADVRSLPLGKGVFDAVVCYGGALSYVREHHEEALDELLRILRPGGALLLSVMSLWGTLMLAGSLDASDFLERMALHVPWTGEGASPEVLLTVPGSDEFHLPMALFSSVGLRRLLESRGCEVLHLAAANPVSRIGLPLERVGASPEASARLLELEWRMCELPGVVDCGAHLIAVARKAG